MKGRTQNPLRLLFEQVSNRIYKASQLMFNRLRLRFNLFGKLPTVDESTVNYYLARSLMEGSIQEDDDGNRYGTDYILASAFAAPVVNSMTAIMLANPPTVSISEDEGSYQDFNATMQAWYLQNQSTIQEGLSNSQSEGDAYLYVKNTFDAELVLLLPEYVEKIVNPFDYTDTIGYNVTSRVRELTQDNEFITREYLTIYRKAYPYKVVIKLRADNEQSDTIVDVNNEPVNIPIENPALYMETLATLDDYQELFDTSGRFEERPLPIVPFHFRKKAQRIYGESVFRNLYIYFLQYHRIIEVVTKNVIFNSISIPFITGIDDVEKFLLNNADIDPYTGERRLNLSPDKTFYGGKDFDIKMVEANDTVEPASKLLNIYFYLIVQASETPEFFFGTAVQSSKASVEDQLPIVINKGYRYQNAYTEQMINLFETVIFYKSLNGDVTVNADKGFDFNWGSISLNSINDLTKLVDALDGYGLITDETKAKILNLGKYVSDIRDEIARAKVENEGKGLAIDQRILDNSNTPSEEDINDEDNIINSD